MACITMICVMRNTSQLEEPHTQAKVQHGSNDSQAKATLEASCTLSTLAEIIAESRFRSCGRLLSVTLSK
jgi:hypothetical protein